MSSHKVYPCPKCKKHRENSTEAALCCRKRYSEWACDVCGTVGVNKIAADKCCPDDMGDHPDAGDWGAQFEAAGFTGPM